MADQLHHYNVKFEKKQFSITLLCDRVNSPANIGSIFRVADSFGVEKIYFCGEEITVISKRMLRTSRSTHNSIPYQQEDKALDIIKQYKANGYRILALEITKNSIPISEFKSLNDEKIVLVIGEENSGVSEDILQLVDQSLHINMYGTNSSMNVAQAAGIALYEITKQVSSS
ncbi:TrmH family RNA methyltransferase [Aquimarina sp. 2201CG5-10]|uniref:TrmH family RNA methyltransferase n=1 Tax=Aquimarina callyspongiae TaxID=3098150 RepID=UPI002AB4FDA7|nr:TrmH family RNA methyltransferase [Aquimarina sp. 2201CG5-10]MDY8138428.1 TrmH family RNA methyltransferase [Aquimarina sp. 2201CG5-10]